jgi:two-component system chemotaxis response regulator CheY
MPNLDGLSFVREMKQMPAYKFTPVIMLTTESSEARKQEGKAAGIRAWVHKPFQPPVLLDAVAKLVQPGQDRRENKESKESKESRES